MSSSSTNVFTKRESGQGRHNRWLWHVLLPNLSKWPCTLLLRGLSKVTHYPPYNQGAAAPYPPQSELIETVGHLIVKVQQKKSKSRLGIKDVSGVRVLAFHLRGTGSVLEPGTNVG